MTARPAIIQFNPPNPDPARVLDYAVDQFNYALHALFPHAMIREGMEETPRRFLKALKEMTSGYEENPAHHLHRTFALDDEEDGLSYDEMILSRGIPFTSLCEHHMLPFSGHIHIGYIPGKNGRVVGLSKLARMAEGFARRFQVQERLTAQISKAVEDELRPAGSAVVVEAQHSCQACRGVRKTGDMVTSAIKGVLRESAARAEFFALCRDRK